MTRTAKRGVENKKKHEASDWNTLKPPAETQSSRSKKNTGNKDKTHTGPWRKGKSGKKPMTAEGKILHSFLHKDQRRERRREKRAKERHLKKVCYKCRIPGHKVEDCIMNSSDQGTGICYKCGSTEHTSAACKAKLPAGKMPFASCYVCGQQGHISRTCPDNPRGLYPLGGGCKTCGSVEHYQRDCSEYLQTQGIGSKKVTKMSLEVSVDAVDDDKMQEEQKQEPPPSKKKKPKVVTF